MCITWYWQLSILIYLMGISFVSGMMIIDSYSESFLSGLLTCLLVCLFWPIVLIGSLYIGYVHDFIQSLFLKITKQYWDSTILNFKTWNSNRKEDKLFYKNHLDDKFERSGIKFDKNDNIYRG